MSAMKSEEWECEERVERERRTMPRYAANKKKKKKKEKSLLSESFLEEYSFPIQSEVSLLFTPIQALPACHNSLKQSFLALLPPASRHFPPT